jgi:hypothetical protein
LVGCKDDVLENDVEGDFAGIFAGDLTFFGRAFVAEVD